jgi:hypothetical protein
MITVRPPSSAIFAPSKLITPNWHHPLEGLLQIPGQIVGRLGADRQPHRPWPDARGEEFVVAELAVRRAGGVDDQALGIADVRQMGPERQAGDELRGRNISP